MYKFAMCLVGRRSGLENRLAVKGSGVRIPNMALYTGVV